MHSTQKHLFVVKMCVQNNLLWLILPLYHTIIKYRNKSKHLKPQAHEDIYYILLRNITLHLCVHFFYVLYRPLKLLSKSLFINIYK